MTWTYGDALRAIKRARDPYIGKPLEYSTRCILHGELTSEHRITVRHHRTDIITFHPDGRKEFVPWNSMTTKQRLWRYGGVHYYNHYLPTIAGRLPSPQTVSAFRAAWGSIPIAGVSSVTLLPDGTWDMEKVYPVSIEVLTNPSALRKEVAKAGKLCQVLEARRKIGASYNSRFNFCDWIVEHFDKPIDSIDFGHAPKPLMLNESYLGGSSMYSWQIARKVGLLKRVQLKILPTAPVALCDLVCHDPQLKE